jgi:dTDP-4-dehydrorhamnose reductase
VKILLLGANGQLGRTFLRDGRLAQRGTLLAASRDGHLTDGSEGVMGDLAAPAQLLALLERERPAVIVNAAAYTAVDKAEEEENLATRINGDAPGMLGRWAAANDALVIHFSTDYVFAGDADVPYTEDAEVAPIGAYGRSKLAGEIALRDAGAAHFIFRTAWVYAPIGHNFLRTMLRLGKDRDELRVVSDQVGTPTDTALIVDGTLAALERWLSDPGSRDAIEGTYHLTASGTTSWHGFATTLLESAARHGVIPRAPIVHAITTKEFPTPARRPAYSVLDNSRFVRTFALDLPDWRVGIDRSLDALPSSSD